MEEGYKNSYCFKHFIALGIHPDRALGKFRIVFNMLLTVCFFVLASIQLYLTKDPGMVESFNAFFIITVKYLAMAFKRPRVKLILENMEQFWNIDVTDDQITFCMKHFKRVESIFKNVFIFAILTHIVRPFVSEGSMFNCYMPPQIPLPLFYAAELYVLTIAVSSFVSFNIFVCSLIILAVVQFKLMNLKIKDISSVEIESERDLEVYKKNLKFIIKYQQFLERYIDELNKLLSLPIALLMVTSVGMLCIIMYAMTMSESTLSDQSRIVVILFAIASEFFMVYGLPAQLLMDESTATADMIYFECKWYLPNMRPLLKDFVIMMVRSQRGVCLKVADYHVLSNRTVLIILRTAYTFCTFLRRVVAAKST